jgi:hypothetical protein
VSATNFIGTLNGSGANVTTLNASNISTGTLSNARTTASDANGASTIVARDASGNFSAGTITANLTGTASTATNATNAATVTGATQSSITSIPNLATVGTISSGTWSGSFGAVSGANLTSLNASNISSGTVGTARLASGTASASTFLRGDQTWTAVPSPNNGTLTMGVSGTGLSGSATFTADQSGNSTFTVTSNASSANGASTIIARDASGNFTANNITANGDVTSSSDETLKTDWSNVIYDFVEKLAEVKSGVYKRTDTGEIQAGVGAQSLAGVLPQVVKLDENGLMSVAYGQAAMVAAVELAKQIVELKKEIEALKKGI